MKIYIFKQVYFITTVSLFIFLSLPATIQSCACGCNVFDVGTNSMFPDHVGGMAFVEYDYQNQNKNWGGSSYAPSDYNNDKQIVTNFVTVGYQKMFNRRWGLMGEIPYWNRYWRGLDANGNFTEVNHSALGDIRLRGIYSGFSPDMATGVTFGLKLPTGDYSYPALDPDTEIGSGSADLLLGAFHRDQLTWTQNWNWYMNINADLTVLNVNGYRPGNQIDMSLGGYYKGWIIGSAKLVPVAQVIGSYRDVDTGAFASDSGYSRLLLTPGLELNTFDIRLFSDVGFPVYQYIKGNQLMASQIVKLNVGYKF